MTRVFRRSARPALLLCLLTCLSSLCALGQTVTTLDRQLHRLDLGVTGVGEFTSNVTGTNYLHETISQRPSSTLGALVTIRYTKSPLVGLEFNYGYARFTQNYSQHVIGGAQTNATEYTLGYVAHAPEFFGVKPFASVGAGTIAFRPTPFGGQGLPTQGRLTYYYDLGAETQVISPHFGLRLQFRELFYLAPDFGQNYLTINQHTTTSQPGVGFYLRY